MTSDRRLCPVCGETIQPGGEVVVAVEVIPGQDFGGEPAESVEEGERVYFHADHVPVLWGRYRIID